MGFLQSVFEMHLLAPHACKTIAQIILAATQFMIWTSQWRQLAEKAAVDNLGRPDGDPLCSIGTNALLGESLYQTPVAQATLPASALTLSKDLAFKAFQKVPDAGKTEQSFVSI